MHRKLLILSLVLLVALVGLSWLGYRAIDLQEDGLRMQAEGLETKRAGEFTTVAELIRRDVKRKLDAFLDKEANRDYAEYQQYYVPQDVVAANAALPILQSPLNDSLEHDFAYGHFQVNPEGNISAPYVWSGQQAGWDEVQLHIRNVKDNVLPSLSYRLDATELKERSAFQKKKVVPKGQNEIKVASNQDKPGSGNALLQKQTSPRQQGGKGGARGQQFPIQSFQQQTQEAQIYNRSRANVDVNTFFNDPAQQQARQPTIPPPQSVVQTQSESDNIQQTVQPPAQEEQSDLNQTQDYQEQSRRSQRNNQPQNAQVPVPQIAPLEAQNQIDQTLQQINLSQDLWQGQPSAEPQTDLVQIRVEPFVQLVVPNGVEEDNIFDGQIFLVRHVQIEEKHFLQGFKLNEKKLIDEVKESAARLVGEGMRFAVSKVDDPQAAYAAILDFEFGELILNLSETDPGWIGRQIGLVQG